MENQFKNGTKAKCRKRILFTNNCYEFYIEINYFMFNIVKEKPFTNGVFKINKDQK